MKMVSTMVIRMAYCGGRTERRGKSADELTFERCWELIHTLCQAQPISSGEGNGSHGRKLVTESGLYGYKRQLEFSLSSERKRESLLSYLTNGLGV